MEYWSVANASLHLRFEIRKPRSVYDRPMRLRLLVM